jgi:hypothetical protein
MAKKYMLINKSLIFYRVSHAASSSTAIGANKMFCILGEWDEVFKYINAKKLSDDALQIAYSLKYSGVDWLFSRLDKHQQYKYLSRIKNELKNDISNINMDIFETILPRKKLFMLNLIKNFPSLFIFFYKFKFLINKYIK